MQAPTQTDAAIETLDVLVTAEEAYPALERAVLAARHDINACFRIFDLTTKLRSPEARRIGRSWFDLLRHALDRGVAIRLVVSDFDAVAAVDLHRQAWRTQRQITALREIAGPDAKLSFTLSLHAARCGTVPRAVFYPLARTKLRGMADDWSQMTPAARDRFLQETPGLRGIRRVDKHDQLQFGWKMPHLHPATHHQKLAVFDGKCVYIGGLDLNERRFDTKNHARVASQTWHDVQVIATGPVVAAAVAHLNSFMDNVSGASKPAPPAAGFLRTMSRQRINAPLHLSPSTLVGEVEAAHLRAIGQSQRLIYLETQFLRHMPIARALAQRARDCPALKLVIVVPAAPEDVAFSDDPGLESRFGEHQQMRVITCLRNAFGPDRLLIASPVQPRSSNSADRDALENAPVVYVHSKVSVFDDTSAIVSSANLNGRSLRWDTEAGLHITRKDQVNHLRQRVMGCWLPDDAGAEFMDCDSGFAHWSALVRTNSALPPQHRRGFLVEYDSDAARATAAPVPGVTPDLV